MTTYQVRFDVEVPDDVPLEDLEAFLRFELGEAASMSVTNALADKDLQSLSVSNVWASA